MTARANFASRISAEFLVGCLSPFIVGRFGHGTAWIIANAFVLVFAGGFAGYLEPVARRVWLHAVVIAILELIALPVVLLTCRGFECGGITILAAFAALFAIGLVPVAYIGFFIRRRIVRREPSGLDSVQVG